MAKVDRDADLTRVEFFSGDMMGKEGQRRWGYWQGTENNKWRWVGSWVWTKMRTWSDEEHWEGDRVNGLEAVVGLKNCWQGGNHRSEQKSNKVLTKRRDDTN